MVAHGRVRQWLHKEGLGTMVAHGRVRQWLHKERLGNGCTRKG